MLEIIKLKIILFAIFLSISCEIRTQHIGVSLGGNVNTSQNIHNYNYFYQNTYASSYSGNFIIRRWFNNSGIELDFGIHKIGSVLDLDGTPLFGVTSKYNNPQIFQRGINFNLIYLLRAIRTENFSLGLGLGLSLSYYDYDYLFRNENNFKRKVEQVSVREDDYKQILEYQFYVLEVSEWNLLPLAELNFEYFISNKFSFIIKSGFLASFTEFTQSHIEYNIIRTDLNGMEFLNVEGNSIIKTNGTRFFSEIGFLIRLN